MARDPSISEVLYMASLAILFGSAVGFAAHLITGG